MTIRALRCGVVVGELALATACGSERRRDDATATAAGELAIAGTVPLHHNAYKVPLLRNLVKRAVRGTESQPS